MKKSLLALAAMGAFAGAAQAQSSVTVYGIMDVGLGMANTRAASPTSFNTSTGAVAATTPNNAQVVNSNYSQIGSNYQSTSRLGFRGTEDLGGGLSAFFTIETAVNVNGQAGLFGSAGTDNRQTFVGLAQKGIGRLALGTQNTIIQNAAAQTDPGQLNNMMGNVVNDKLQPTQTVANGNVTAQGAPTAQNQNQPFAGNQNNTAFTVRSNNMLWFSTDSFNGFKLNGFYALVGNTTDSLQQTAPATSAGYTGGETSNQGWGLGADFTWQKLLVTANYQSFTSKSAYAMTSSNGQVTAGTPTIGFFGGSAVPGTNIRDNQQYYAATYDFGILKAYVQYVARKAMPSFSGFYTPTVLNRTAQQIGVRGNVTKTVETWASVGNGSVMYYDTNKANIMGYQLGANYWLSKRTNLYAIYGAQSTSNAQITTGSTAVNPTSYNASSAAIGVRHTF